MNGRPNLADVVEIMAAVVISVAAALTSWAGFQSALWDGEQDAFYARAASARVAATRASTAGGQLETADLLMFHQWLNATALHRSEMQAFYRQRFRSEFAIAFEAWLTTKPAQNPAAPSSPFAMAQYHSARLAQAETFQRDADGLFAKGEHANDVSDRFVQSNVLLAIALFFGGISQTFKSVRIKAVLVAIAVVIVAASAARLIHLPILALQP